MSDLFFNSPPYPFDAFPTKLREVAYEIQRNVQAPDAAIGMALLGAAAAACQPLIRAKSPAGTDGPVTLFQMPIITSGDRKTGVYKRVFKPFEEYDAAAAGLHTRQLRELAGAMNVWTAQNRVLQQRLGAAVRSDAPDQVLAIQRELSAHGMAKPNRPEQRCILHQDMTPRALLDALEGDRRSIAIVTDEGAVTFDSWLMRKIGLVNRVWDSPSSLSIDRADGQVVLATHPLVTLLITAQHQAVEDFLKTKHGQSARGLGFWARILIACPPSRMGTRWMSDVEPIWTHLHAFYNRVNELLDICDRSRCDPGLEPEVIELSDDAKALYVSIGNRVEAALQPGQYLSDISDFASKALEHHTRIAAVLHYFNGEAGKVSLDTFQRAAAFVEYHIHAFKRMFSPQYEPPQWQTDANRLHRYLQQHVWRGVDDQVAVPRSCFLHKGPVRQRDRLSAALNALWHTGAIWLQQDVKTKSIYVYLNNEYFARQAV